MVIRLMTFNAVPSSYEGRDITPLIDALRKAPEQISSQDRPAVIQLITSILATDFPPKVWNAAALALLKISPDNVSRLIGPILKRPDKAKEAGTLLYVIDKSDTSIPLDA